MGSKREFERSRQTNDLFQKLAIENRIGVILKVPDVGEVQLRGDLLREFIWAMRSHKCDKEMDRWLTTLRHTLTALRPSTPLSEDSTRVSE